MKQLPFIFLSLLMLLNPMFGLATSHQINIGVIYSNEEGKSTFLDLLSKYDQVSVTPIPSDSKSPPSLNSFDIIFVETSSENLESALKDEIEQFINTDDLKSIVLFSSRIDEFSNNFITKLGVGNYLKELGEENTEWTFTLRLNESDISASYLGKVGIVTQLQNTNILGTISSVNESEVQKEISGGEPIILERNSSLLYSIAFMFDLVSPVENGHGNLHINALPDLLSKIDILIQKTVKMFLNIKIENSISSNNISTAVSNNTMITSNSTNSNSAQFPNTNDSNFSNSLLPMLLVFVALIALFFRKIISFLQWVFDQILKFGIFIIGSAYHVQNRQISEGQLLVNPARKAIIDYLEYLEASGAHLREIKKAVGMGMGNLLWHLQILEEYGWVEKKKVGRYIVYIASEYADQFDYGLKMVELNLRSKHAIPFLEFLVSYENIEWNISTISEETGINRKTVRNMLNILTKNQLIKKKKIANKEYIDPDYDEIENLLDILLKKRVYNEKQYYSSVTNFH